MQPLRVVGRSVTPVLRIAASPELSHGPSVVSFRVSWGYCLVLIYPSVLSFKDPPFEENPLVIDKIFGRRPKKFDVFLMFLEILKCFSSVFPSSQSLKWKRNVIFRATTPQKFRLRRQVSMTIVFKYFLLVQGIFLEARLQSKIRFWHWYKRSVDFAKAILSWSQASAVA